MIQNSASFDEDEIEVSNILVNLKDLIEESESRSKRRRCDRNLGFNSPSPNSQVEEDESGDVEIEPKFVKLKSEKTNPNQTSSSSKGKVLKNSKFYTFSILSSCKISFICSKKILRILTSINLAYCRQKRS